MENQRIIIAGGRDFMDYALLKDTCDRLLRESTMGQQPIIVSGHANGADMLGERYAMERGWQTDIHPADWKRHGRAAGPIRNREMALGSSALIAFWDGKSRGTKNMIDIANKLGLQVAVVDYSKRS